MKFESVKDFLVDWDSAAKKTDNPVLFTLSTLAKIEHVIRRVATGPLLRVWEEANERDTKSI